MASSDPGNIADAYSTSHGAGVVPTTVASSHSSSARSSIGLPAGNRSTKLLVHGQRCPHRFSFIIATIDDIDVIVHRVRFFSGKPGEAKISFSRLFKFLVS